MKSPYWGFFVDNFSLEADDCEIVDGSSDGEAVCCILCFGSKTNQLHPKFPREGAFCATVEELNAKTWAEPMAKLTDRLGGSKRFPECELRYKSRLFHPPKGPKPTHYRVYLYQARSHRRVNTIMRSFALSICILAAVLGTAAAYPQWYYACEQPTQGYGYHSSPVADNDISFILMDSASQPVTSFVPGQTYQLKMDRGAASRGIVFASAGSFTDGAVSCDGQRATFEIKSGSHAIQWTAPPSVDSVTFESNFATSPVSPYYQSMATFTA
eukprot:jgi/Tetstr1/461526/TSEL_006632.t1